MDLMKCPDCAESVSARAANCPRCGCPLTSGAVPRQGAPKKGFSVGDGMRLGIGVFLGLLLLSFVGCGLLTLLVAKGVSDVAIEEQRAEEDARRRESAKRNAKIRAFEDEDRMFAAMGKVQERMTFAEVKKLLGIRFKEISYTKSADGKARFVYQWITPTSEKKLLVTFDDGKVVAIIFP